jgi:phosphomannomutase
MVKPILEKYKSQKAIGNFQVTDTDTKDGVKLYFDNSWILVRPSGTEPLLRIYFESDSLEKLEQLKMALKSEETSV